MTRLFFTLRLRIIIIGKKKKEFPNKNKPIGAYAFKDGECEPPKALLFLVAAAEKYILVSRE